MAELSFFAAVDRLVAKSQLEREQAKAELKAAGFRLRVVSEGGVWRATRYPKGQEPVRLWAATPAELVAQARADYRRRHPEPSLMAEVSDE